MSPTALPATPPLRRPFSRNLLAPAALATLVALTGCATLAQATPALLQNHATGRMGI